MAKTISAYADTETALVIARIAKIEDRSPAQIAAAALRFYARLPSEAHAALRRIEASGTAMDMDLLAREITRKTLDAEWELAHRQMISEMKSKVASNNEDEILTEAVRLTR